MHQKNYSLLLAATTPPKKCVVHWKSPPKCEKCGPLSTLTQRYQVIVPGTACPTPTHIICPEIDCCNQTPWTNWPDDCPCDNAMTITRTTEVYGVCSTEESTHPCSKCPASNFIYIFF